jgi:hypothetical protein
MGECYVSEAVPRPLFDHPRNGAARIAWGAATGHCAVVLRVNLDTVEYVLLDDGLPGRVGRQVYETTLAAFAETWVSP